MAGSVDPLDLDTMPALSEEFYRVDDFFTTYLAELAQQGKRRGDPGSNGPPSKHARVETPALPTNPAGAPVAGFAVPPQQPPPPQLVITPSMLQQVAMVAPAPQPLGAVQLAGVSTLPPNLAHMMAASGMQLPPGYQPVVPDGSSPPGLHDGRNKTHRQQAANKVAQQRYRERKKEKFATMEATVAELQAQLAHLQALQQRNTMLEGMNTELEKALSEKEGEVERLKGVLDAQADESLADTMSGETGASDGGKQPPVVTSKACCGPVPGNSTAGDGQGDDRPCVPCDVLPRDLSGIDFRTGFSDQMTRLRAFMAQHNLEAADPLGRGVDRALLMELAQVVGRSCQLCQAALRADGVRVLDLVTRDPKELASIGHSGGDKPRWDEALRLIRLSAEQQEQLLLLRGSHLAKLREIYQERQGLNMAAMAQMLPHQGRTPQEDTTLEGRMTSVATVGYLPAARSSAELAAVLNAVKDNLRREQRAVMDLNCCTISKIMSPIQAALYMMAAYPQHCDALALSNVLARSLGREASSQGNSGAGGAVGGALGPTAMAYPSAGSSMLLAAGSSAR